MSCLWRCLMLTALCATLARAQSQGLQQLQVQEQEQQQQLELEQQQDRQELKKNSHIYLGIYKNYKSTYLGNKTTSEYKKRLRDRVSATEILEREQQAAAAAEAELEREREREPEPAVDDALAQELRNEANAEALLEAQTETEPIYDDSETAAGKKRRKRKRKTNNRDEQQQEQEEQQGEEQLPVRRYQVGPGLNVSLDMSNDIVRVKLDGENLKEIIGARWLSTDNSEEGESINEVNSASE